MARPAAPLLGVALRCRCPRCGEGKLFEGLLTVRPRCLSCGLDLSLVDTGDGPAVAVIFILGTIDIAGAFWVEFTFAPPLWVHAVLWPLLSFPLAIALMRPLKAALVALQYRTRETGIEP